MKYDKVYKHLLCAIALNSCSSFVDVAPPANQLVGESVYGSNSTATAAISGIYRTMTTSSLGGGTTGGIGALLGLSADEFSLFPTQNMIWNQTYTNSLTSDNNLRLWGDLYNCIYQANSGIEGLTNNNKITAELRDQLLGECKFIRSLCTFYLVTIFGDIPLITTTDYKLNSRLGRSDESTVYRLIITDLKESQGLLKKDYVLPDGTPGIQRVRPNVAAATALLARVYLFQEKWDSAEIQSTAIIDDTRYELDSNLNNIFVINSKEAILQLEMPYNGFNAPDGAFIKPLQNFGGPRSTDPITLSETIVKAFDTLDKRKSNWIKSVTANDKIYYYPFKYKLHYTQAPPEEYPVVLRMAEQYLIRAEARAKQNNLLGAIADLNIIKKRAGLSNSHANTQSEIITAIHNERRLELFTEYGHRWLDLKRSNKLNEVMTIVAPLKGGIWNTADNLYPIPRYDILSNSNLTQNPGYN